MNDKVNGALVTNEMISLLENLKYSDAVIGMIFRAVFGARKSKDGKYDMVIDLLKIGFEKANNQRKERINKDRERKRNSTERRGTPRSGEVSALAKQSKAEQSKAKHNNPLSPNGGKGEIFTSVEEVRELAAMVDENAARGDELVQTANDITWAQATAGWIVSWYPHRVTSSKLATALLKTIEKNPARATTESLVRWKVWWEGQESRYVPGSIVGWVRDGRYLEDPPAETQKTAGAREERAGVVLGCEATVAALEDVD